MKKNSYVYLITFVVFLLSPVTVWAQDCSSAEQLHQQAKQEASLDKRVALLERAVQQCESFRAYYELGNAQASKKQLGQARKSYKSALLHARSPRTAALAHARLVQLRLMQPDPDLSYAMAEMNAVFDLFNEAGKTPPSWVQKIRKYIEDNMAKNGIVPSEIIASTLSIRSFAAVPRVDLQILFELDSDVLQPQGRQQIKELLVSLEQTAKSGGGQIHLLGHTDIQGSETHNLTLSQRRAESVKRELIRLDPTLAQRIDTTGHGEQQPIYTGNTEDDHRRNRRVEVQLR